MNSDMNPEDIKLENELDEFLDQAGAGDFEAPKNPVLSPLFWAAKNFTEAEIQVRAKNSFARALDRFPATHTLKTHKSNYSFSNFIHMATNRLRFVRPLGTALAILFLLLGGINFYRVYSDKVRSGGGGYLGLEAASVGVATGLSAPSEGIIDRAKRAVGLSSGGDDMAEPSIAPMPPEFYPFPQPQTVPGSDTREYNKTSYYASVKSRQANELAEQMQTMIRGWGGRIDNSTISDKNSYISFVLPKTNLEQLRNQLKNAAGVKFVVESVSSQNLLPQKIDIEKSTNLTTADLAQLESEKSDLTKSHNATLASLNHQLNAAFAELKKLDGPTSTDRVKNQINYLQKSIASENSLYEQKLNSLNTQIKTAQISLGNLAAQDTNLNDSVESVQGSISFIYVGYWDSANIYLGGYLPAICWLIAGVIIVYFSRRKYSVAIEPVQ